MKEKFSSVVYEELTQSELQKVNGGFLLLLLATASAVSLAIIVVPIYGAYQMGYDKACGCKD